MFGEENGLLRIALLLYIVGQLMSFVVGFFAVVIYLIVSLCSL